MCPLITVNHFIGRSNTIYSYVCLDTLRLFEWHFHFILFFFFLQNGGIVQSYVDGCCKTCESRDLLVLRVMLWAVNRWGERLVAWQWMGLLAEWLGVWPVVEGGDKACGWPNTTFPTIPGFLSSSSNPLRRVYHSHLNLLVPGSWYWSPTELFFPIHFCLNFNIFLRTFYS